MLGLSKYEILLTYLAERYEFVSKIPAGNLREVHVTCSVLKRLYARGSRSRAPWGNLL